MSSLTPRLAVDASDVPPAGIDTIMRRVPQRTAGWPYLGLLTAVFILVAIDGLVRLLPWWPEFVEPNLDASWTRVLQEGFLAGMNFGRDLAFTYGPWAFVVRNLYHPALYGEMLLLRGLLVLMVTMSTWRVGLGVSRRPWLRVLLAAGLCVLTTELLAQCPFTEGMYYLLVWYMALYWIVLKAAGDGAARALTASGSPRETGDASRATGLVEGVSRFLLRAHEHLLIAAGAFLTVIKFSYGMAVLAVLACIAVKAVLGRRRVPRVLLAYAAEVILFWLLADQPLSGLPHYFWNSLQVARGYAGMQMGGPLWHIICFALAFALLIAAIARDRWPAERWQALVGLPLLAFIVLLLGKASFVRHDWGHWAIGAYVAEPICLVTAAALCRAKTDAWTKLLLCGALAAAFVLILPLGLAGNATPFAAQYPISDAARRSLPTWCRQTLRRTAAEHANQWTRAGTLLRGRAPLPALFEQSESRARELYGFPRLLGTVDVYPELGSIVYSRGARYQPRPTIQSYCALTWRLALMNAAHLRSSKAPDWILFSLAPFEGRFPSLQDGPSWPELLSRYEIQPMDAAIAKRGYLLLKKSEKVRPYELLHLAAHTAQTGAPLPDVPSVAEGPVWVSLRIRLSAAGQLAEAALKAPRVYLECITQSGSQETYRFDPDAAAAGFLLSPLVADTAAYQWLAVALADKASWRKAAPEQRAVKSLRVVAPRRWAYRDTVEVDYYRLRLNL
ncbi:MAG: hypothetical protein ABSG68_19225 [Thermoguttaceae bacterium]|jgi:hypothetical protein